MAKIGFLGPKRWFNSAPTDFLRLAPEGTEVAGAFIPATLLGKTMAGFSLDVIKAAVPGMNDAARDLADAGADIVAQFGVPFSLTHGPDAHAIQACVASAAGVPVVLMGVAMLEALAEFGARRVAVAGGYYTAADWAKMARSGLESNGFEVVYQEGWIQQGIVGSIEEQDRLAWDHDPAPTCAAVRETARRAPDSTEAIVVLGGGLRLIGLAKELEEDTGLPVVGGDLAMFWATLRAMKAKPRSLGWGRLIDNA
ncbi:MAG: arylmalonate decarboxylase [Chloroflexi bacterium]|nr:MAG: arylmalonate decarboxylase [Chloroflexota bacterium]